jgi:hypothetical protein
MNERTRLLELARATLEAIARREPRAFPGGATCRYTENGRDTSVGAGLWLSAGPVRSQLLIADAERQQAVVFAALEEGDERELILLGLRMRAEQTRVTELEALVSREGQSSAFAPGALLTPPSDYDQPVSVSQRSSRKELQAAADRYFDGIEQNSSAEVPFHADCQRFENGLQTTGNPAFLGGMGCREQLDRSLFAYIEAVRARRYPVFDEERGAVLSCVFLDVPGTVTSFASGGRTIELPARIRAPRSVLLFELFKVVAGEIRRIDALMTNLALGAKSGWD